MTRLSHLFDPDAEPAGLQHARERQTHQRWKAEGRLYGHAVGRLAWLETAAYVWTDAEVRAWDERTLQLAAELFAAGAPLPIAAE